VQTKNRVSCGFPVEISEEIQKTGIKSADSLHVACVISDKCDYFISVDKRLLKYRDAKIAICDHIEYGRIVFDDEQQQRILGWWKQKGLFP
jgi:hypothetical protein